MSSQSQEPSKTRLETMSSGKLYGWICDHCQSYEERGESYLWGLQFCSACESPINWELDGARITVFRDRCLAEAREKNTDGTWLPVKITDNQPEWRLALPVPKDPIPPRNPVTFPQPETTGATN
ncbi:hypothetical protein S7711_10990 [Stachybotrys chartarum IBT 7711]|uniref:Uncharacterized protein n=1 Tax=Stachybotrys chartarum (strain CBS 109288 / IBT 7711) TaxID=1280523 RepID=A0A084AKN9_STACB|nr:hypothetical protein S7711_10990 [Stachybotrys chartarum IBT 7711]KFA51547.1 hypothetical protein S40293_11064 [Stachybotrys chartarum IBT 40293]